MYQPGLASRRWAEGTRQDLCSRERQRLHGLGRGDGHCVDSRRQLTHHPGQRTLGSKLDEAVATELDQALDVVGPAHGRAQLALERDREPGWVPVGLRREV